MNIIKRFILFCLALLFTLFNRYGRSHDKSTHNKNYTTQFFHDFVPARCAIVVNAEAWAQDTPEEQVIPVQTEKDYSFSEAVIESVTGDVYSDPSKWQDLSCSNLFSEGRDKPWASPPNGSGRTTSRLVKCL